MADIVSGYEDLKHKDAGYLAPKGYPQDFQTVDFPALAGKDGKVTTMATYQAFFFTGRKDPGKKNDGDNQKLDTSQLEKLFKNIYDNKTHFTMKLDADALRADPQVFAKKLADAGDDFGQVKAQVEIMQGFVNSGGIPELAKKVVAEKMKQENHGISISDAKIEAGTEQFLKHNFKLEGVETAQAMKAAVWQVEAKDHNGKHEGALVAKQNYYKDGKWDGAWQVGTQPEVDGLAKGSHQGAREILGAAQEMNKMKETNLTNGVNKDGSPRKPRADLSHAHAALEGIKGSLRAAGVNAPQGGEPGMALVGAKPKSLGQPALDI